MADYAITVANVAAQSGSTQASGTSGATITQGDAIYIDASDSNKIKVADCTTSAATAAAKGIALNSALSGQPVTYAKAGSSVNLGTTLAIGDVVILSEAGAIAPVADLASADYLTIIGHATSTTLATLTMDVGGLKA